MLSRGLLPADAVEAQAEELTARLAELDRAPLTQPGPRTFGTYARGIEAWDALDLPHKRALLRQMGARITLVRIGRAFKATPEQPGLTIEWE